MSEYKAPTAADLFIEHFNRISESVEYNPKWANGTGYFDYAVGDSPEGIKPTILPGATYKCIDKKNRKMIFVGTPLGWIVMFERYSHGEGDVITHNEAQGITNLRIIPGTSLTYDNMNFIMGYGENDNIGSRLAKAFPSN